MKAYSEYRTERLEIFESLMKLGITKAQLESASEKFNALSEGNAETMMDMWRTLHYRMTN